MNKWMLVDHNGYKVLDSGVSSILTTDYCEESVLLTLSTVDFKHVDEKQISNIYHIAIEGGITFLTERKIAPTDFARVDGTVNSFACKMEIYKKIYKNTGYIHISAYQVMEYLFLQENEYIPAICLQLPLIQVNYNFEINKDVSIECILPYDSNTETLNRTVASIVNYHENISVTVVNCSKGPVWHPSINSEKIRLFNHASGKVNSFLVKDYFTKESKAEYVVNQELDSYLFTNRLNVLSNHLKINNLEWVGSNELIFDTARKEIYTLRFPDNANIALNNGVGKVIEVGSSMINADAYRNIKYIPDVSDLYGDMALLLRSHFSCKIGVVDEFLLTRKAPRPTLPLIKPPTIQHKVEEDYIKILVRDFNNIKNNLIKIENSCLFQKNPVNNVLFKQYNHLKENNDDVAMVVTFDPERINYLCQFIDHYISYGVKNFYISLHFNNNYTEDEMSAILMDFNALLSEYNISIFTVYSGSFDAMLVRGHHNNIQQEIMEKFNWIIWADSDELHEFPSDISTVVKYMQTNGYDHIKGQFVDRISRSGFPVVTPHDSLWKLFPIGTDLTKSVLKGWSDKVVISSSKLQISPGNHRVVNWYDSRASDLICPIHHFKWDSSVVTRLKNRLEKNWKARCSWWTESEHALNWINKGGISNLQHVKCFDFMDDKIPSQGGPHVNEKYLFSTELRAMAHE